MSRNRTLRVEEDGEVVMTIKLKPDAKVYLDGNKVGMTKSQYIEQTKQ